MGRERGWVAVSVRTYQSHRSQQNQPQNQRVMQQDYTVDESGATLNAVSRSADVREEERIMAQMAAASNSNQPTTSIFIRDWKVRTRAPGSARFFPPRLCSSQPARDLLLRGPVLALPHLLVDVAPPADIARSCLVGARTSGMSATTTRFGSTRWSTSTARAAARPASRATAATSFSS